MMASRRKEPASAPKDAAGMDSRPAAIDGRGNERSIAGREKGAMPFDPPDEPVGVLAQQVTAGDQCLTGGAELAAVFREGPVTLLDRPPRVAARFAFGARAGKR